MAELSSSISDGAMRVVADAAFESIEELLRELADRPGFGFSDAQVLANLRAAHELAARVDALRLSFVEQARIRPGIVPGSPTTGPSGEPGRAARLFLTEALRMSSTQARRDVEAAEAIHSAESALPLIGAAFGEGLVSRDHLDVALGALREIPKTLRTKVFHEAVEHPDGTRRDATGAELVDALLTGEALAGPPGSMKDTATKLLAHLNPDRDEKHHPEAYERRSCTFSRDYDGNIIVRMAFDAATGLELQGAIERRAAKRLPTGTAAGADGTFVAVPDRRSNSQRRADAASDLILAGARLSDPRAATPVTTPVTAGEHDPISHDPGSDDVTDVADSDDVTDDAGRDGTWGPATGSQTDPDRGLGGEAFFRPDPPQPREPGTGWQAASAVDITLVVTTSELIAAHTGDAAQRAAAGLAQALLANRSPTPTGQDVPYWVLARLTCDNPIRRILIDDQGVPLDHGRAHRLATRAQRHALSVRDAGCCIPGCNAPPRACEIHHLTPWEHGGGTDLDNLLLLCRRHHTAHHAGVYQITIEDGVPWVRTPAWIDHRQPWLRNTTHDRSRRVQQLAAVLINPDVA